MVDVEKNLRNNMVAALLGLHAQTALHPGSGSALGTVDLPVQRERHTQWPTIPGSTLKGILPDACREQVRNRKGKSRDAADGDPDVVIAFGPPTGEDEKHAGAHEPDRCQAACLPSAITQGPLRLGHVPRDLRPPGARYWPDQDVSSLVGSSCDSTTTQPGSPRIRPV